MEYIDFVNKDRFDEMEELSKSLFGEIWDSEEVWDAIHELSDIRAGYNLFDENEVGKYYACSLAIKALRKVIEEPIKE